MLKAKTDGQGHESRTLKDAIADVTKLEEVLHTHKIPKELHSKFKMQVIRNNTTMKKVLNDYIAAYIDI